MALKLERFNTVSKRGGGRVALRGTQDRGIFVSGGPHARRGRTAIAAARLAPQHYRRWIATERDGVRKFAESFDRLLSTLEQRVRTLQAAGRAKINAATRHSLLPRFTPQHLAWPVKPSGRNVYISCWEFHSMLKTLEAFVGNTPLVRLQRLPGRTSNIVLAKLEGNNPAGSVKDRPALSMIRRAEERGTIKPGDTLIEPTSGNTGIALAMAAAMKGYRMVLVMPEHMSVERRATMKAFGAEIVLVSKEAGMEGARDLADRMQAEGKGLVLNQFANPDNPLSHYEGTGSEIWRDTEGRITHFVSSMGTTGTIMGVSRFLKEKNRAIQIVGVQPAPGSSIPGIRAWPKEYLPKIYDASRVDRIIEITQAEAEEMARRLAREEGIFCGISSGGATHAALRLSREVENAVIVVVIADRGDRYLSTGVFPE